MKATLIAKETLPVKDMIGIDEFGLFAVHFAQQHTYKIEYDDEEESEREDYNPDYVDLTIGINNIALRGWSYRAYAEWEGAVSEEYFKTYPIEQILEDNDEDEDYKHQNGECRLAQHCYDHISDDLFLYGLAYMLRSHGKIDSESDGAYQKAIQSQIAEIAKTNIKFDESNFKSHYPHITNLVNWIKKRKTAGDYNLKNVKIITNI